MKVSTQPYKGARDFYPEDKRMQEWMFNKWKSVIERFGYEEYDAPILEPTDLYLMKGSQEIVQEQTYTFKDRGDRSVTIRTEMTPTVSRMIAGRRQEMAYPARWYSIPNLWRYERMQRGRLREFWQLNVDVFGIESLQAEAEMIQIVDGIFQAFKAKRSTYVIKVNSRKLVNSLLIELCELDELQSAQAIRVIDRMNKMSESEFLEAINKVVTDEVKAKKLITALKVTDIADLPEQFTDHESVIALKQLLSQVSALGMHNIVFDLSLMRGFDYYTDIVFEAFDTDPENNRSMFGGGRYDGLVAQFGVEPVPTVGFGMGDVTFMNFLESHKLLPDLKPVTEVIMLLREESVGSKVQQLATRMRESNVNVAIDFSGKKVDKQLKSAIKQGVRFALFVGEDDISAEQFILKDLVSGKEEKHGLERIIGIIKDRRYKIVAS
jgi:histidyl-tRNA synthetase